MSSASGKPVLLRRPKLKPLHKHDNLYDGIRQFEHDHPVYSRINENSSKENSDHFLSVSVGLDIANANVKFVKNTLSKVSLTLKNKNGTFKTLMDNSLAFKSQPPKGAHFVSSQMIKHNLCNTEDEKKQCVSDAFTLQDFMIETLKINSIPAAEEERMVYSLCNYKSSKKLLNKCQSNFENLHTRQFNLPDSVPNFVHRIPQRQLLIEMASVIKEHIAQSTGVKLKSTIHTLSPFHSCVQPDSGHGAELIFYENCIARSEGLHLQSMRNSEIPGRSTFLCTASSKYFQGTKRTASPFDVVLSNSISPSEASVLESIVNGGETLNLKANFISSLPFLQPLKNSLIFLDLSFNSFEEIPIEVFDFTNLAKLKLRNNPLSDFPHEISRLHKLKTLVISFCLFDVFSPHLFELKELEELDISYNTISCIPSDIALLQKLHSLNVEGNRLCSLPASMLKMPHLQNLQTLNNFLHQVFWKDSTGVSDSYAVNEICGESQSDTKNPKCIIQKQCDVCRGQIRSSTGCQTIHPVRFLSSVIYPISFCCCSERCLDSVIKAGENIMMSIID